MERYVIRDGSGQYWAGEGRWSDKPAEAVLFHTEIDATEERNRHCLGGDEADTFTRHGRGDCHARRWSEKELARHLKRHRKFFIGGPGARKGCCWRSFPTR